MKNREPAVSPYLYRYPGGDGCERAAVDFHTDAQLCFMRYPGRTLTPGESLDTLGFIARQLDIDPNQFRVYLENSQKTLRSYDRVIGPDRRSISARCRAMMISPTRT
jgi:hypothetical protein